MPAIDSGLADWLKSASLNTSVAADGVEWGDRAVTIEQQSPIDLKAEAQVEAARIVAFMSGPLVKDRVTVKGRRRDLLHRVITATGNRVGYTLAGVVAFVIGVAENENGTTSLTVLRKLT
ncbi:MAG: hypothetical protein H0U52_00665 [Chloroflexi bacterium]|nr:hypothetical protein [Chloroflexota bacterium]